MIITIVDIKPEEDKKKYNKVKRLCIKETITIYTYIYGVYF